jgi:hypothetical protein
MDFCRAKYQPFTLDAFDAGDNLVEVLGRLADHDGFRLMVRRDYGRVRLFTRNGHDCAGRYPALVAAALPAPSILIDGEAVVADAQGCCLVGAAAGPRARSRRSQSAFDLLELDGKDLRVLPLEKAQGRAQGPAQAGAVRPGAQ